MRLCNSQHVEICFEEGYCPLCSNIEVKNSEIYNKNEQIKSLEKELENAADDVSSLSLRVSELEKEIAQ